MRANQTNYANTFDYSMCPCGPDSTASADTEAADDLSSDDADPTQTDNFVADPQDIADPSTDSDPQSATSAAQSPLGADRAGEAADATLLDTLLKLLKQMMHKPGGHHHPHCEAPASHHNAASNPDIARRSEAQSNSWRTIGDDATAVPTTNVASSQSSDASTSVQPTASQSTLPPPAVSTPSSGGRDIAVNGGGINTISVKNTSSRDQTYALFTNPTPGMSSSFGRPDGFVTLKAGESANFKLPAQSSGYVQQVNNYTQADYDANKAPSSDNFKATRAEYTFNADGSLYFNDSNIDGYNASVKMTANDQVAGSSDSILASIASQHPSLIETIGGQQVIRGAQFFSDAIDTEARDALDLSINHNANGGDLNGNTTTYVLPNDDKAVRGTKSNSLTLEFGNM